MDEWMDEGTDVATDGAEAQTAVLKRHLRKFISK